MSNIQDAKAGLRAEIEAATAGMMFYKNRITELEKLSQQIGSLDQLATASQSAVSAPPPASKRKYTKRTASTSSPKKSQPPVPVSTAGRKRPSATTLPSTGAAFWKGLVTAEPISNKEILGAGIRALGIKPDPQNLAKLKQRLASFLTIAAKDGSVTSTGSGRSRRFSVGA